MKNTSTSHSSTVKQMRTRWLLPILAMALGLSVPSLAVAKKSAAKKAPTKAIKALAAKKAVQSKSSKKKAQKIQKVVAKSSTISRPKSNVRSPASLSAGISDSQKSLEIRGQSRNLSMLLVLKNRHENIDFVKPREAYREEVEHTQF